MRERSQVLEAVLVGVFLLRAYAVADGAPVLRSADARIAVTSPHSCEVMLTVAVADAGEVEHRLAVFEGTTVDLVGLDGAGQVGAVTPVGRTQALVLRPDRTGAPYTVRYRVRAPDSRDHRCPLWIPTVPTDGQSRGAVQLQIDLPSGAVPNGGSLPSFAWRGGRGTTTLGHVPAFVRVPYAGSEEERGARWDVTRAMDATAAAVFIVATACWVWRRRR
ncbi:MAG: hypothetical protein LC791_03370 [Acidobacteria bacterium]|nr:hypothetical protein [Acidobacteriota bacterium]